MHHVSSHLPVTALTFLKSEYILSGEGSHLCIYSIKTHKLLAKRLIFERQAIHGILVHDTTVLIWGGSLLLYIRLDVEDHDDVKISTGMEQDVGDWILNASFAHGPTTAAVVTAHDALFLATKTDIDDSEKTQLQLLLPGAKTILYSAHLRWLTPTHILIASGTAFGDVTVWSAYLSLNYDSANAKSQTHYSFPAHSGSVFGVQVSPLVALPGLKGMRRVLASCSDDRNIKLWDISDLSGSNNAPAGLQETGFGARSQEMGVTTSIPKCLAWTMGHVSRIWHVRFESVGKDGVLRSLRSFGEDAAVVSWKLVEDDDAGLMLRQQAILHPHSGKNIWSVGVCSETGMVATGGADGAVALLPFNETGDVVREVSSGETENGDGLRAYCFVKGDVLLATTDQGRILRVDLAAPDRTQVTVISPALPGLRGYSVVAGLHGLAFIGGNDGAVYCYAEISKRITTVLRLENKIAGLFCCSLDSESVALLTTTVGCNTVSMQILDRSRIVEGVADEIRVPLPNGFAVTAFTALETADDTVYAAFGSRKGSILLYRVQIKEAIRQGSANVELLQHLDAVHGKEAITSLSFSTTPSTSDDISNHSLLSTARNGHLAIHRLSSCSQPTLTTTHNLPLPFGPNITGHHLSLDTNELLVWGFRSKDFVVYSVTAQREVARVECGGAHRMSVYQSHDRDDETDKRGGTFVWTKAGRVYRYTHTGEPYKVINGGGHGREIKCLAISSATISSQGKQIVATGAEDTDIKLSLFTDNQLICVQTLRGHNTGIQHLQFSDDGRYLFSSGGFEEFFVWKLEHDVPGVGLGVVCASRHPRSGLSDLRITSFFAVDKDDATEDVKARTYEVVMTYSDSSVKMWTWREDGDWVETGIGTYLTASLTAVAPFDKNRFITTATDGHLTFWNQHMSNADDDRLEWRSRHRIHQSAILALATHYVPSSQEMYVITGGDDNALAISRLSASGACKTLRISRAHAAAVTGIAVMEVGEKRFRVVSAALDQRIKVWEVRVDGEVDGVEGVVVNKVEEGWTGVADVNGVVECGMEAGRGVVVAGVGWEMWRSSSHN